MSEWWSYGLSDFLMFSPRTYYRLLELYNRAVWPGHVLGLGLGTVVLALWRRQSPWRGRFLATVLAAAWLWVAWGFHFQRYAAINWAATYFAAAFALQAALLLWAGVAQDRLVPAGARVGRGIFVFALLIYPLIGPLLGRPWSQGEVFGVAPDPTVIATLGVLAALTHPPRLLLAIPLLWCLVSGATLWAMKSPEALLPPLGALAAVLASRRNA